MSPRSGRAAGSRRRACVRWALAIKAALTAGLGVGAALAVHAAAGVADAADYRYDDPNAIRAGIVHGAPRLCPAREPTQRDLRVLRLAYGLPGSGQARLGVPWYLSALMPAAGTRGFALESELLWDIPADWVAPPAGGSTDTSQLDAWVRGLERGLDLSLQPEANPPLAWRSGESIADPFFWSRVQSVRLLPFVQGWRASALETDCIHWPAGLWLVPGGQRHVYRIVQGREAERRTFVLFAFADAGSAWAAFRRERLDALLVEGNEHTARAAQRMPAGTRWSREFGGQQIVLLLSAAVREALEIDGVQSLSQAIPRQLAADGVILDRLLPAQGFFSPVGALPPERSALRSDPRLARRGWLSRERNLGRPRLGVLSNPVLVEIGRRIAAQWQRTLNLSVALTPIAPERFAQAKAEWRHEFYLDVVDLEDGSLQDLWNTVLQERPWRTDETTGGPAAAQIQEWEAEFHESLPYLPVLQKTHWIAARGRRAAEAVRALCPNCTPSSPPPQVREQSRTAPRARRTPREG